MDYIYKSYLVIFVLFLFSCSTKKENQKNVPVQIAFMADVHLQDIYAHFSDTDYKGIENPSTGKYNTIRTMDSQLHSTRLFNENYFAFLAALDDVVKRGVKIVALPGDFTDDGQLVNVKALRKILDSYAKKHQIQFFITTGNHDPVRPFAQNAGKTDFLAENGGNQIIVSSSDLIPTSLKGDPAPVITADIKELGYEGIAKELANFGFFPKEEFQYWETPFSNYTYDTYNFKEASTEGQLKHRTYEIGKEKLEIPDVSYLVEPIDGVWLLAIDANVYLPKEELSGTANNPKNFGGASNNGYNSVLKQKKHLIRWVKKIATEAKKHHKKLVAFSHYPMVEFNDGASKELKQLFGEDKMQLKRVPAEEVAQVFADAGLKLHFGGHMHINDTGVRTTFKGNTIFNIQTPSLAGYMPAYKLLTFHSNEKVEVETVPLTSVENFRELLPLYKIEHDYLTAKGSIIIWNENILAADSYISFTDWHLKELIRLRFLPEDWPIDFSELLQESTGKDLFLTSKNQEDSNKIKELLQSYNLVLEDLEAWNGKDMVYDYYRIKLADELVFNVIGDKRLLQYKLVSKKLNMSEDGRLVLWAEIFEKSMNGKPSDNFIIDLVSDSIYSLKK
ncbi:calcineurin-like phosphoesterase family protein [Tenacibaculum adriaticum]|uniref:Calcineurin-like phosphoesterase family protein n=1 Tax=Tenacibaculum adriaticum TaxID=413713 RepID=A0A5S5DUE0_9FLAO|nr:metallophosphoesterase [Tenacibaculum adriaticum]TYP99294.1 calcineurin-like phosphoesterase family protein [Tenacibaculum adriaticum]